MTPLLVLFAIVNSTVYISQPQYAIKAFITLKFDDNSKISADVIPNGEWYAMKKERINSTNVFSFQPATKLKEGFVHFRVKFSHEGPIYENSNWTTGIWNKTTVNHYYITTVALAITLFLIFMVAISFSSFYILKRYNNPCIS